MPQKSSNPKQLTTRASNAKAHPGAPDLVGKRKHRTKAEIEADNKAASDAKAAKEAKRLDGLQKIASLEMAINEEDSNDVTPKPRKQPRPLRRTKGYLNLPLDNDNDHEPSEPLTELAPDGTEDEYQLEENKQDDHTDTDIEEEDEERLAQPKRKKVKVQVRQMIKSVGREIGQGQLKKRSDTVVDREAGHGNKIQATGLVFPFSPLMSLSLLTLDRSTLFYFSLNSNSEPLKKVVKGWASNVDIAQGTLSKPNSSLRPGSKVSSTRTVISESTLVDNIIISRKADADSRPARSVSPADPDMILGGFKDEDESLGPERDAVISSPIKGSGRVTNNASHDGSFYYILITK